MKERDELFYLHQELKDAILRGIATSERARVLEGELAAELEAIDEMEEEGLEATSPADREYFETRLERIAAEVHALSRGERSP